ncbi:DUF2637 domain-containing protein [Streptomyces sp. NPDC042319]|uniref:DUF2637 domain-containing protein n=1 Tax=Streptomyces sp. NPDC042319 TaxID=3154332 RepID=UPI0033E5EA00
MYDTPQVPYPSGSGYPDGPGHPDGAGFRDGPGFRDAPVFPEGSGYQDGSGRHRLPRQAADELGSAPGFAGMPLFRDDVVLGTTADGWDAAVVEELEGELAQLLETAEQPVVAPQPVPAPQPTPAVPPTRHRKTSLLRKCARNWSWRRALSMASVTLTALIVIAVSILGALASYPSLRALAGGVAPRHIADLWPLLIYGPWIAATLSILRARAYRRRTAQSWLVVIFFAAVAMLLCIAHTPTTPAGITVAGLPPVTVLLCFHQLVRQLDLSPAPSVVARHAQNAKGNHRQRTGS